MTRDEQVAKAVIVACAKVCEGLVPHYYHRDMLAAVAAIRALSPADLVAALPIKDGLHNSVRELDSRRLDWLDQHCAFVADGEYKIGPFKIGELRQLADAGMAQDFCDNKVAALPKKEPNLPTAFFIGLCEAEKERMERLDCAPGIESHKAIITMLRKRLQAAPVAQPDDRAIFEAFALSEGFVDSAEAWKNRGAAQPGAEEVRKVISNLRFIADDPCAANPYLLMQTCKKAADILAKIGGQQT